MMTIRMGVARGVFSNESGLGSSAIAAAAAQTRHPVRQAMVSMTQTFIDTIVVCTLTGLAIIVTGVLAAVLGLIALPVGQVVTWLAWLFLAYMLLVVNIFAALPLAYIEVGVVTPYLIGAYYLGLALAIYLYRHRRQVSTLTTRSLSTAMSGMDKAGSFISLIPKKWLIPPLLVIAILVATTAATMPDDKLHVSFLDVGQGDAILVQTPAHHDILVDGGPSPQAISLGLGQKMPFWDRTIDLVVLTHPHADHITGLVEVLKRYRVKQVLMPDWDSACPIYDEWLESIEAKQVKQSLARAGQQINLGDGIVIEVLNPPIPHLTGTESDIDNNGVVLKISMDEISFLLTADIMWEAEFGLSARGANLNNTVLKVAHCGSKTSTTPEFLAMANPRVAVISVGDNPYGHPSPEVISRLEDSLGPAYIYRTDEQGTIEFITDGEKLWVAVEKPK
jgi:competence protein ComEC